MPSDAEWAAARKKQRKSIEHWVHHRHIVAVHSNTETVASWRRHMSCQCIAALHIQWNLVAIQLAHSRDSKPSSTLAHSRKRDACKWCSQNAPIQSIRCDNMLTCAMHSVNSLAHNILCASQNLFCAIFLRLRNKFTKNRSGTSAKTEHQAHALSLRVLAHWSKTCRVSVTTTRSIYYCVSASSSVFFFFLALRTVFTPPPMHWHSYVLFNE